MIAAGSVEVLRLWLVVLSLVAASCETGPASDLDWGLGEKADDLCDPTAPLCWTTADLDAIDRFTEARSIYAGGDIERAAAEARAALESLSHKLEPDELDALDAARSWPELAEVGARLADSHLVAHAVALGRSIEAIEAGKGDELDDGAAGDPASASLEKLKRSNAAGRVYGTLIQMSRAHRRDYEVIDRDNFRPSGPSRDERVDRAIARRKTESGLVGIGSGLVSLAGGTLLAVPAELAAVFSIHARLAFEIAGAHGWDIHAGDNLYVVSTLLLTDGELAGFDDELATVPSLPAMLRALGRDLGLPITSTLATSLTANAVAFAVRILARKAAEILGAAAAEQLGKAAAKQVLHWASLGLGVIASGAANYHVTGKVGEHVAVLTRPWLIDLPLEGTEYLDTPSRRACHARALGTIALADGRIAARERDMIDTLMAKPYYLGDGRWGRLTSSAVSTLLAEFDAGGGLDCVEQFADLGSRRKLAILSHLYGMAVIDRQLDPREESAYRPARDVLDGDGWFDGPEINPLHLRFVERAVARAVTIEYDIFDW